MGKDWGHARAIQTVYRGFKFRSRNEARWAVWLDALGIEWQYEPEGFELGDGTRYLPDFWLPGARCWVEIKPSVHSAHERREALEKAEAMAAAGDAAVLVIAGEPWPGKHGLYLSPQLWHREPGADAESNYWEDSAGFVECRECRSIWIVSSADWWPWGVFWVAAADGPCEACRAGEGVAHARESVRLQRAYEQARQARFEFGDRWTWAKE